ncbi:MAG: hypothetical protein AB8V04_05305 [Candidatus Midichloria sp.]
MTILCMRKILNLYVHILYGNKEQTLIFGLKNGGNVMLPDSTLVNSLYIGNDLNGDNLDDMAISIYTEDTYQILMIYGSNNHSDINATIPEQAGYGTDLLLFNNY